MQTSGALARSFTPSLLPCLLAASLLDERSEALLGEETLHHVRLRRITLPVQRPLDGSDALPWQHASLLRVRAFDPLRRPFASPSGSRFLFSPTTRYLAVAAGEGRIFVWDLLARRTLPPLEAPFAAYAFAPALSGGQPGLRLLLAGPPGLLIATFVEASRQEHASGIEGQWDLLFKPSETPLSQLIVHALSGQVALGASDDERLFIWDLETLCSPLVRTLDGREGSPPGPHCVHFTRGGPVDAVFTPDGRQLALLHVSGHLTLHQARRPGLLEVLRPSAQRPCEAGSLAISPDGCRLAAHGEEGLRLWKRMGLHESFDALETAGSGEQAPEDGEVLAFTHQGDPVVLTPGGRLRWYDRECAALRQEVSLAACEEEPPVSRRRYLVPGGYR